MDIFVKAPKQPKNHCANPGRLIVILSQAFGFEIISPSGPWFLSLFCLCYPHPLKGLVYKKLAKSGRKLLLRMTEFKLIFLFNQFYNLTAFDMLLNMLQYNKMF